MSSARIAIVPAATRDTTAAIASARRRPSSQAAAPCGRDPDDRGGGPREDHAEPAGDARDHPEPLPLPEREREQADGERRAGERREVVDPEERRLALSGAAALELVQNAEELQERPERRGGAPRGERRRAAA